MEIDSSTLDVGANVINFFFAKYVKKEHKSQTVIFHKFRSPEMGSSSYQNQVTVGHQALCLEFIFLL